MNDFQGHLLPRNLQIAASGGGGNISGSGTSPQITYFNGAHSITGSPNYLFQNNAVLVGTEIDPTYVSVAAYNQIFNTLDAPLGGNVYVESLNINADIHPTTNNNYYATVEFDAIVNAASTHNISQFFGFNCFLDHEGSGTVLDAWSGYFTAHNSNTAVMTNMKCLNIVYANTGAGSVTNAYGIYIENPVNDGTNNNMTNAYGIYIQDQVSGTNHWSIKTGLGLVELGDALKVHGDVGFFATTPVVQQIGGSATAGAVYTSTEEGMINRMYTALRAYGLLT
jgi:hypothetical protein